MISPTLITFPHVAAANVDAAMDELFDYFPDHYPVLIANANAAWVFRLDWPLDPAYYVDPQVPHVAAQLYGLDLQTLSSFIRFEQIGRTQFALSLVHSRALLAVCMPLHPRFRGPCSHIVHVDDHTDLMPPLLWLDTDKDLLYDDIFHQSVDLTDADLLEQAIDRGVISKGNFLTAYMLIAAPGQLIHVGPHVEERSLRLAPAMGCFTLAGRLYRQTRFVEVEEGDTTMWQFHQTKGVPSDLILGVHDGVWLDVDLDAFCNRYLGDSDLRYRTATAEERNDMEQRIEQFLTQLANARWISSIAVVTIALSPGFFPADYWAYAASRVYDGITAIVRNT